MIDDDFGNTGNIAKAIECANLAEKLRNQNADDMIRLQIKHLLSNRN